MKSTADRSPASALVVTLLTLSALSLMAASAALRIFPRLPIAYQNAAWEEARVAAEAGIDVGMSDLLRNVAGPATNTWTGWQEAPASKGLSVKGLVAGTTEQTTKLLHHLLKGGGKKGTPARPVELSDPIYLDNLNVSAPGGIPTEVDVQLWALQSAAAENNLWFKIRSTATCALPPMAYKAPEKYDPALRRLNLRSVRASLQKNLVGQPSQVRLPNVSRTVEAIVEPILPFELAIWTAQTLSLASTGAWNVDSYDSSNLEKSMLGAYPGRADKRTQANGHIACSLARPASALHGPLIAANGTRVRGAVATNGGDDASTEIHENVSGTIGLDLARVRDDFLRQMSPVARVLSGTILPPPASGTYVAGSEEAPNKYLVPGSLTSLRIAGPGLLASGLIVIFIDGNLNLAQPLIIPPSVTAVLYVRGDIIFRDSVNSGPWSSNRPGQLLIFGDAEGVAPQKLQAFGDSTICAAFYAPRCEVELAGSVHWCGSLASRSFRVTSGGDGGVHYDEALAPLGPPISFRIIRCVEDVRE